MNKKLKSVVLAGVMLLGLAAASPAAASTLQIQMTGMNFVYTDAGAPGLGTLCDSASCLPFVADPLTTAQFFVDGNLVGTLNANISADIATIVNLPVAAAGVTPSPTTDGFFQLLIGGVPGLSLILNDGAFIYSGNALSWAGLASVQTIVADLLPFGFDFVQPVVLSFSANVIGTPVVAGGFVTSMSGNGTPEITGQSAAVVPEPATLLLLGTGLLGLAHRRRKALRK